ncbi:MAG: ABC transporter ATP-binding protein [Candidatus Hydrogenedentes bacterium]|nr:ABC transporter ATP-binding protein [Candidatus Hydrogenedentota bacterium]
MPIVELDKVTKTFRASRGTRVLLGRGGLAEILTRKKLGVVTALDDISFTVEQGESLGIIGANGSGKSTLLKIIAGVTVPTEGTIGVRGRVASLLELGAGFHPMLTGRENVYLNAGILGMRHSQVDAVFDQILEFSGIGKFIDYPIGTYSSGMYVRLGFAVAAFTDPDIFLIDEVLSVGDEAFQHRCRTRIGELMEMGKTIVFVSHDLSIVNSICERVILLSLGKMILRDTSRKAIDFYLRQVGDTKGLHTFAEGDTEVVFSNGRISFFHAQEELTSASGFVMRMYHLGNQYSSQEAEWEVVDRGKTSCVVRGRLDKLKLEFVWSIKIENADVVWSIAMECDEPLAMDTLQILFHFPTDYDRTFYDEADDAAPELRPEDTRWFAIRPPELLCDRAAILDEDGNLPAVTLELEPDRANLRGSWWNSEYIMHSRVLLVEEYFGKHAAPLGAGHTDVLTARISVRENSESVREESRQRATRRTVESDGLRARFDRGRLVLSYEGKAITTSAHVYSSLRIGGLWNDSISYQWESLERDGAELRVKGRSRRFPVRQEWIIRPAPGGIALEIWLEVFEALDVEEYHTSVLIDDAYTEWQLDGESGQFPNFDSFEHDWQHLNTRYAEGACATAWGAGMPKIRFEATGEDLPHRMTVLNTNSLERARALQALRVPEHSVFHLSKGRHPYFAGQIRITPEQ